MQSHAVIRGNVFFWGEIMAGALIAAIPALLEFIGYSPRKAVGIRWISGIPIIQGARSGESAMASSLIGKQAVVIGAGLAGLTPPGH